MEETLVFETYVKRYEDFFIITSSIDNDWKVVEKWWKDENEFVHGILMSKRDQVLCSYYYADMEVSLVPEFEYDCCLAYRVKKTFKTNSYKMKFMLHEKEYTSLIESPAENILSKVFRIKIVLSPILKFVNKPALPATKSRKKRPTKGHVIEGLKNLSHEIHSLVSEEESVATDVILYCGMQNIKAHRAVLSARSPRFCKLFFRLAEKQDKSDQLSIKSFVTNHTEVGERREIPTISELEDMAENITDPTFLLNPLPNTGTFCKIFLNDVDVSIFKDFIDFIYSGIFKPCEFRIAKELYLVAVKYEMKDFEAKCLLRFLELLLLGDDQTSSDFMQFACDIDDDKLKLVWSDYIKKLEERRKRKKKNRNNVAAGVGNNLDDPENQNVPNNLDNRN